VLGALLILLGTAISAVGENKAGREEGTFHIRMAGNEVGSERFTIIAAGEKVSSASVLEFRNPAETHQRVQMETRLEMNNRFVPLNYQLKSDVDGKKGTITGLFSPGQAMFEYVGTGTPRKAGVLVGKEYTLLDSNIFHHFIFLARLFDFDSREKVQKFEVVIPQETDSGVLSISDAGKESVNVRGKKIDTRRLQVDSGALVMQLWVDRQHMVVRIAVPSKQIDVERE
jgi:hypothetical protein